MLFFWLHTVHDIIPSAVMRQKVSWNTEEKHSTQRSEIMFHLLYVKNNTREKKNPSKMDKDDNITLSSVTW